MKVLVTGAGGMLGRDVVAACERRGDDVVPLAHAELDITDGPAVDESMREHRPDAIVNCAAWTDVDGAEEHEAEATLLNSEAAGVTAAAAAAVGASIVHPSSDYVFDGKKRSPYVESDPTGPLSAYGRSKHAGGHRSRSRTRTLHASGPRGCSASRDETSSRRCCTWPSSSPRSSS